MRKNYIRIIVKAFMPYAFVTAILKKFPCGTFMVVLLGKDVH